MVAPMAIDAILGLLQMGMNRQAPYDAAKAQTYATKELFNNLGDYTAIANAVAPPSDTPFLTVDEATGNKVWHSPMMGINGKMAALKSGNPGQYWTEQIAKATEGAKTKLPQEKRPGLLKSFLDVDWS